MCCIRMPSGSTTGRPVDSLADSYSRGVQETTPGNPVEDGPYPADRHTADDAQDLAPMLSELRQQLLHRRRVTLIAIACATVIAGAATAYLRILEDGPATSALFGSMAGLAAAVLAASFLPNDTAARYGLLLLAAHPAPPPTLRATLREVAGRTSAAYADGRDWRGEIDAGLATIGKDVVFRYVNPRYSPVGLNLMRLAVAIFVVGLLVSAAVGPPT